MVLSKTGYMMAIKRSNILLSLLSFWESHGICRNESRLRSNQTMKPYKRNSSEVQKKGTPTFKTFQAPQKRQTKSLILHPPQTSSPPTHSRGHMSVRSERQWWPTWWNLAAETPWNEDSRKAPHRRWQTHQAKRVKTDGKHVDMSPTK